jgi:hypothetical protein
VLDRALGVAEEFGAPAEIAGVLCSQASAALEQLHLDEARERADRSLALSALPHPMRLISPAWVRGVVALRLGDLDAAARDFASDLPFHGGAAGPRPVANSTLGLAWVDAARGRAREAVSGHAKALRARHRMGDRLGVAESLLALGAAVLPTEPAGAARLFGASASLRSAGGAVPTPRQHADLDVAVRAAVDVAGAETVAAERSAGSALTQQAAVASALDLSDRLGAAEHARG